MLVHEYFKVQKSSINSKLQLLMSLCDQYESSSGSCLVRYQVFMVFYVLSECISGGTKVACWFKNIWRVKLVKNDFCTLKYICTNMSPNCFLYRCKKQHFDKAYANMDPKLPKLISSQAHTDPK